MSSVRGLSRFREYMTGLEGCYAVIGGTACDILLSDADLPFRATKDIDMALIVENGLPDAARAVWRMVRDGGYRCGWGGSEKTRFYRFAEPSDSAFPSMIELFSRSPDFILDTEGLAVVPLPVEDDISSLSAILLDDEYYAFMKTGRRTLDGIAVLDAEHLIPFKAKAFVDLATRRAAGEHVDSRDVKKHKNDVFRLAQLLVPGRSAELPTPIRADMGAFLEAVRDEGVPLRQIGVHMTLGDACALLEDTYDL